MITVTIEGDRQVVARFASFSDRLRTRLGATMRRLGYDLQAYVQRDKLSGGVLKVRTGALRSSINLAVAEETTRVEATVGTNVFYGKIHEFGVPHAWTIMPKSARVLAFPGRNGDTIFARSVVHPPLPERSFLRSALRERTPAIVEGINDAVRETATET